MIQHGYWHYWVCSALFLVVSAAFGQWDFKRLVAYSSINHMGFVVLGIAVFAWVYGLQYTTEGYRSDAIIATNGTVMQMFNHGLSAAGMFFLVGVIYERTHTRDLKQYGGIWSVLPYSAAFSFSLAWPRLDCPD